MKEDRRLRNLRYQMRKKGYQIDTKILVDNLPSHDKRSLLQERRLSKFGFSIQYNMFEQ